jgi:hypothetical protein
MVKDHEIVVRKPAAGEMEFERKLWAEAFHIKAL